MPPLILGERRHLSNSQVELLLECSWKHKLKYIDDIPEPSTEHLIVGAAVHRGVESYRIAQMEGRLSEWSEDVRNDIVLKSMNDEFDKLLYEAEHGTGEDAETPRAATGMQWSAGMNADRSRQLAKQLLNAYFYKPTESDNPDEARLPLAAIDVPVSIEESFYVAIPKTDNWFAKGRFDMVTKNGIVDLKTARQKYSQKEMDKKTQPSFYSLAWLAKTGEFLPDFRFHMLIKPQRSAWTPSSGEPPPEHLGAYRTAVQQTRRRPSEVAWFLDTLRQQIYQIEVGAQVRRQNADWCDYCGVAKHCKPWLSAGSKADDVLYSLREELRDLSHTGQDESPPIGKVIDDGQFE